MKATSTAMDSPTPRRTSVLVGLDLLRVRKGARTPSPTLEDASRDSILCLPPLESRLAILSAQRNKWKFLCLGSVVFCVLFGGGLIYTLNHKLFARMGAEYLVVPGAAEYVRVRPNLIPDEAVFAFAEYVATYAGTFTYRNAKTHFATIAERMEPELKGRFIRDTEARFTEWERRRVDQVFSFDPVRRLDVLNDKFGSKYALVVRGKRTQYADGTLLQESEENLYLVLRPRVSIKAGSRADESLFQIERLEWVTRAQAETLVATRIRDEKTEVKE